MLMKLSKNIEERIYKYLYDYKTDFNRCIQEIIFFKNKNQEIRKKAEYVLNHVDTSENLNYVSKWLRDKGIFYKFILIKNKENIDV